MLCIGTNSARRRLAYLCTSCIRRVPPIKCSKFDPHCCTPVLIYHYTRGNCKKDQVEAQVNENSNKRRRRPSRPKTPFEDEFDSIRACDSTKLRTTPSETALAGLIVFVEAWMQGYFLIRVRESYGQKSNVPIVAVVSRRVRIFEALNLSQLVLLPLIPGLPCSSLQTMATPGLSEKPQS